MDVDDVMRLKVTNPHKAEVVLRELRDEISNIKHLELKKIREEDRVVCLIMGICTKCKKNEATESTAYCYPCLVKKRDERARYQLRKYAERQNEACDMV